MSVIYSSIYVLIYLSIYLSIYALIYLYIYLSVYLSRLLDGAPVPEVLSVPESNSTGILYIYEKKYYFICSSVLCNLHGINFFE